MSVFDCLKYIYISVIYVIHINIYVHIYIYTNIYYTDVPKYIIDEKIFKKLNYISSLTNLQGKVITGLLYVKPLLCVVYKPLILPF